MNNIKQHIKKRADRIIEENKNLKHSFESIRKVDFDIEVEGLKYKIALLQDQLEFYKKILESVNFSTYVILQILQDNKLATKATIELAAKKVTKLQEKSMNNIKEESLTAFLVNPEVKAVEA